MFLVNDGENPKSSNEINEKIVVKIAQTPTVSDDNNLKINGNKIIPDPNWRKVDK